MNLISPEDSFVGQVAVPTLVAHEQTSLLFRGNRVGWLWRMTHNTNETWWNYEKNLLVAEFQWNFQLSNSGKQESNKNGTNMERDITWYLLEYMRATSTSRYIVGGPKTLPRSRKQWHWQLGVGQDWPLHLWPSIVMYLSIPSHFQVSHFQESSPILFA